MSRLIPGGIYGVSAIHGQEQSKPALPDIPGITTEDRTPRGCVDCHKNHPERNYDGRLTSVLKRWENGVRPEHFQKAKAAMPPTAALKGRHPAVQSFIEVIPDDCLMCHWSGAKVVPPFSKILHTIHLTGGRENHLITNLKGQCTHCHKLDETTGTWRMGSGLEN